MVDAERMFAPRKIRRFTGYLVCWSLCLAALLVALVIGASQDKNRLPKQISSKEHIAAARSIRERKIYPLSVIGGGAYSAEELNRARRLDSVVSAHYADFGKHPVVRQTPKDLLVYVSYRKSDTVYWTRTKRRIPKGESVLSDGKNLARARCGNRLSFTPQQPTSPEKELSEEAFNTPEAPKISLPLDTLPLPETEADLYLPAEPLPANLLSSLPSPSPFAASHPIASPGENGGYLPPSGWGTGPLGGGTPLLARGSGFPTRTNAGSGTSSAVPAPIGALAVTNTPEPEPAKLLLLPILVLACFGLRRRLNL